MCGGRGREGPSGQSPVWSALPPAAVPEAALWGCTPTPQSRGRPGLLPTVPTAPPGPAVHAMTRGTLTAQLLDGGPLFRLLPRLCQLLVPGPHGLQQQADAVLQEAKREVGCAPPTWVQREVGCATRGRALLTGFSLTSRRPTGCHYRGEMPQPRMINPSAKLGKNLNFPQQPQVGLCTPLGHG